MEWYSESLNAALHSLEKIGTVVNRDRIPINLQFCSLCNLVFHQEELAWADELKCSRCSAAFCQRPWCTPRSSVLEHELHQCIDYSGTKETYSAVPKPNTIFSSIQQVEPEKPITRPLYFCNKHSSQCSSCHYYTTEPLHCFLCKAKLCGKPCGSLCGGACNYFLCDGCNTKHRQSNECFQDYESLSRFRALKRLKADAEKLGVQIVE